MLKIDILSLFPEIFTPLSESIIKRAQSKGLVEINIHDLRDWAIDKHGTVDDKPYSGGAGMVIRVDVVQRAISNLQIPHRRQGSGGQAISKKMLKQNHKSKIILMSPQGTRYDQEKAKELSKLDNLVLVAGHYEGFDERIREHLVDEEISIGDYVLTGGELPAMVIVDSVVRLIPGVLGDGDSLVGETHSEKGLVKHPVYTRPEEFNGWKVPEVLLSGNPKLIDEWKSENSKKRI